MKEQKKIVKSEFQIKKQLWWLLLFGIIAILSVWAIFSFQKDFAWSSFLEYLNCADFKWLVGSMICVVCYILLEGLSILTICKSLGYHRNIKDGFVYSAADIYFSAITPSASGGQPASAYFMHQSKIPGSVIGVALLFNLLLFSLSILILGMVVIAFCPSIFFEFNWLSKCLIFFGFFVQFLLMILYYCLLYKDRFLYCICKFVFRLLERLHLLHQVDEKLERLELTLNKYQNYARMVAGKRKVLLKCFLLNLLQRFFQVMVVVCTFLATGGSISQSVSMFVIETFVIIGAYCVPIPGAMGVTDYLMIDGFRILGDCVSITNLELLSRGISFYGCIFLCGIVVLIQYFFIKKRRK